MKSIAVIGQGFVGGALTEVFAERGFVVRGYDRRRSASCRSITHLIKECGEDKDFLGVYFVCVPTPMNPDGSANLSIVSEVLTELSASAGERTVVIKSTVPPGSTQNWNRVLENLHVIHNPEFLTEANALEDMRNQNRIILGGPRPWINTVKQIYRTAFPKVPIIKTSSTMAEMVKYFTNVQLAARVVLSCEIAQLCEALDKEGYNIDYDKVVEYAQHDPRLGGSHMNVPGKDGIAGARGHCFPKDLNALIAVAKQFGVTPTVMRAAWDKNLEIVKGPDRDWEKMVGRAVAA